MDNKKSFLFLFQICYKSKTVMRKKKDNKTDAGVSLNDMQITALSIAFKRNQITIRRWAKMNSYLLQTKESKELIKQFENTPNQIPSFLI